MIFHRVYCWDCKTDFIEKTCVSNFRICGKVIKTNYHQKFIEEHKMFGMKVYIAASFPRIKEAQNLGIKLEAKGFEVTSYWHQGDETKSEYHSGARALRDYIAVEQCDLFIELIGDDGSRGGRHCELGLALAWKKKVMLIGSIDDCIFTNLPYLPRFQSVEALLARLT